MDWPAAEDLAPSSRIWPSLHGPWWRASSLSVGSQGLRPLPPGYQREHDEGGHGRWESWGRARADGEPLTLAVYGQRGGGSVERVTWKIEIASLLERLFLGFFSFFS
jgi:hypothetical protein